MATVQEYLAQRRSPLIDKWVARVALLDANENILEDITTDVLGGSITINKESGSRRSASLTLNNKDRIYNLSPTGKMWLNTKFQIWTGVQISSTPVYYSRGIFCLGDIVEYSTNSSSTVEVQLYDKATLIDSTISGTLLNTIIIPNGTNINTAFGDVLSDANTNQPLISYTTKPLISEPSSVTITYTLRVEEGSACADILNKLADSINRVWYFDESGYPRFEADTDTTNDPEVLALLQDDKLKLDLNKRTDITNLKNKVRVVGGDFGTGVIYDYTASDTTLTSPTRVGLIGARELYIQDDVINSNSLAQLRGDYELSKAIKAQETVSVNVVPLDYLDVGMIVRLVDDGLQVSNERYIISQITTPIFHNGDSTQLTLTRERSFS